MQECSFCQETYKDNSGPFYKCAFLTGKFSIYNHLCAAMGTLRDLIQIYGYGKGFVSADEQTNWLLDTSFMQRYDLGAPVAPTALFVGWYKNRSNVENVWLMFEHQPPRVPTVEEFIEIVNHYTALRKHDQSMADVREANKK